MSCRTMPAGRWGKRPRPCGGCRWPPLPTHPTARRRAASSLGEILSWFRFYRQRSADLTMFPAGPVHPFASGPVSPSATAASKVMEGRLTGNAARATLAILELVHNLNPRPCRTTQKMDPVVPCALRLLSKSTVCLQAPGGACVPVVCCRYTLNTIHCPGGR